MFRLIKSAIKNVAFQLLIHFFEKKKTLNGTQRIGVSTLLCHRHVDIFIYNLQSLFYQIHKNLPIYIIDDGTLTTRDINKLKTYFSITIESSTSSEKKITKLFHKYNNIYRFRFDTDVCAFRKKLDAFFLHPFTKCIYLDADLLWQSCPREIIQWLETEDDVFLYTAHHINPNTFFGNREAVYQYSCRLLINDHFSCPIDPSFNSGLLCMPNKQFVQFQKLDEIFRYFYTYRFVYTLVSEETAIYLAGYYDKMKKLPADQYKNVWAHEEYENTISKKTVSMHYSGGTKDGVFKRDALKLAIRTGLFRKNN